MIPEFMIDKRKVGGDAPCYVVAEISCNHEGDIDEARRIIDAARDAGADAVKIQTYTADTLTRDFKNRVDSGSLWDGLDIYAIYKKAQTPWDWHGPLARHAEQAGVHLFSSPFDETAVDYLMEMDTPVFKVASFEIVDIKLLQKIAETGKPVILSTGMTTYLEIKEAVDTLRAHGAKDISVLHCNSGYPAPFSQANLKRIRAIGDLFGVVPGLSDHTMFADAADFSKPMGHVAGVEAVRLGAKILELHITLDREAGRLLMQQDKGGYDWAFSKEPQEVKKMIGMIRHFERTGKIEYETREEHEMAALSHGIVTFEPTEKERTSLPYRPSLWMVRDIKAGEMLRFAAEDKSGNFDSIRPGGGLHIRFADYVEGKTASRDLRAGEPLSWDMIDDQIL